jgi:hypothetical protein
MGFKDFVDLGTETLAVFRDHIILLLAIIAVAFIGGSRRQKSVDDGEVRGCQADKAAAETRLALAHDRYEMVIAQGKALEAKVADQDRVIALLQASSEKDSYRVKELSTGNNEIKNALANLTTATAQLGGTLSVPGGMYDVSGSPVKFEIKIPKK